MASDTEELKEFRGTKMLVDGERLSSLFQINSIQRPSTPVEHEKQETLFGYRYMRTKEKDNTLTVEITIRSNEVNNFKPVQDLRDDIVRILYADKLRRYEFTDQPDRYWIGKFEGSIELDYINPRNAKATIELWIPAGHAFSSLNDKEFKNNLEDEPGIIQVENNGTKQVYPQVEVLFTKESGYLALMDEEGHLLQFGNPEEVDGTFREKNEMLFNDHMTKERDGWVLNQGVTPPVTWQQAQVGNVRYVDESNSWPNLTNEGYFKADNYGSTGLTSWHGPALTKIIPLPSDGSYPDNWHSAFRFDFNNDGLALKNRPHRVGHLSVTYSDQNDNIICSFVIEDNNTSAERSDLVFYVGNRRTLDDRNTNKYYTNQRYPGSWISIEKIGRTLTLRAQAYGFTKTFNMPDDVTTGQLRKVTVYMAQYQDRSFIQNMVFRALQVTKYNTVWWDDFPNIFQPGDFLAIDFASRSILRNGQPWDKLGVYGNEWFPVKPGTSEIVASYSDWALEPPEITLKFKELWY